MRNNFLIFLSASTIFFILTLTMPLRLSVEKPADLSKMYSCSTDDLSGEFYGEESMAFIDGENYSVPRMPETTISYAVLGSNSSDKWIEVDLSDQKLIAREGDSVFLETPVSTGLPATPTPLGEFRIWIKLRSTRMQGGVGRNYYNLPNVPYVMYFANDQVPGYKGYGLHGAYWHNSFGTRRSHGCVNLPIPAAEKLYYWATPNLPDGKTNTKSTTENPGTRIVIHE